MHTHLLFFLLLASLGLHAQDDSDIVFGRVDAADRAMTHAPGDSTAEAYVLYDRLSLDFEWDDNSGPSLVEKRHRRVKLLTPASFERANFEITFDKSYRGVDKVEAVIHPATGGTIVVPPSDILREPTGEENYVTVKFAFPQVAVGSIIEYRYEMRNKSILLPTNYVFQEEIPVRYAQYDAIIPPYYTYVSLTTPSLDVNEMGTTKREWGPTFGTTSYSAGRPRIDHTTIRWAMRDLPAFRRQPYSNNAHDYQPAIRLQLQQIQYPGRPVHSIFADWDETAEELQARQGFGKYYRNRTHFKQLWKAAEAEIAALPDARQRALAAYAFINRHLSWDGEYDVIADQSPDDVFASGRGNSADLNIALLSLLNAADVPAQPVLVSLRNSGAPIEQYPLLRQFDHVLVYCELDGKPLFLDAGDRDRPAGLPHARALNHRGWIADAGQRWIDIDVPPSRRSVLLEVTVDENGAGTVRARSRMEQYYALEGRTVMRHMQDKAQAPLVPELTAAFPDLKVDSYNTLEDASDTGEHFNYELNLQVPVGQVIDDYLYLRPVLLPLLDGELADAEHRYLPIDFEYPYMQRYAASFRIPAGYTLEDAPAPVRLRTADNGITASYTVSEPAPGTINVAYVIKLDRTLYPAAEYGNLREMFRRMIELQESPLVLKRAK